MWNNRKFNKKMKNLPVDTTTLQKLATFGWDKAFTFIPGTSKREIEDVMGFRSDAIKAGVPSDGGTYLVFVKGKRVVGYVTGTREQLGYHINFGPYKEYYLCIYNATEFKFIIKSSNGSANLIHLYE